jgi:hypothetical protein
MIEILCRTVCEFSAGIQQKDDMTAVVVKVRTNALVDLVPEPSRNEILFVRGDR